MIFTFNFRMMRFPERQTMIGNLINQYLSCIKEMDDHAIHLLFSANRYKFSVSSGLIQNFLVTIDNTKN